MQNQNVKSSMIIVELSPCPSLLIRHYRWVNILAKGGESFRAQFLLRIDELPTLSKTNFWNKGFSAKREHSPSLNEATKSTWKLQTERGGQGVSSTMITRDGPMTIVPLIYINQ